HGDPPAPLSRSLRDIEACLGAVPEKLYHLGFRTRTIGRSTLADANEKRDWRIYADFAQVLIDQARRLYSGDSFVVELELTVYALDSTTIDACLSLFPGLLPEPGSIYVLDRGYTDFARLQLLALPGDFVIRARRDFRFDRRCSRSVDG